MDNETLDLGQGGKVPFLVAQQASAYRLGQVTDRYLVDPASSHMLVFKTKPCKSKYKSLYGETADGSLKQLLFI